MFESYLVSLFRKRAKKKGVSRRPPRAVDQDCESGEEITTSREYKRAYKLGVKEERARVRAILDLPETQGRYAAAVELATSTDLPVSAVREYLRSMPKRSRLAEDMALVPNPDIGPEWPSDGDGGLTTEQAAARVLGHHNPKQTGDKT